MTIEDYLDGEELTLSEYRFFIKNKSKIEKFAKLKCQELLEIVAEKAEVGSDWEYKGGDSNIVGNYTKTLVYKVDKNSILNAVELDSFIV